MKKIAKMQRRTILTLAISTIALLNLCIYGCYPVLFQESMRADTTPEYRTKYFALKPPKGKWRAVVDTQRFTVPYEGDLLSGCMPERIEVYSVPLVWAVGLREAPALTISSFPILEPERFHDDPKLIAEAVKSHFEQSRKKWSVYRKKWSGGLSKVEIKPSFRTVEIHGKTFYVPTVIYADTKSIMSEPSKNYYFFTKKRAFVFHILAGWEKDSELLKVIGSFEPIDFTASKEEELLEKALYLCFLGLKEQLVSTKDRTDFISAYSFEKGTQALLNAVSNDPDNYIAHIFLGIHYLTPVEDFYQTVVAPNVRRSDAQVERVSTEYTLKFNHYSLNQVWVVNKIDVYLYLLHGNFDDNAAIVEFEKALELKPESYTARYFLSWLYLRNQEYEKAILKLRELSKKDPQDADVLLFLSIAYKGLGSEKEANEYYNAFKKAVRVGTPFDFLDKLLGPALAESLGRALGEAIGRSISR